MEGGWVSKENGSSVGKEEGTYGCWLGIWLKSLPFISFTIIAFIIPCFNHQLLLWTACSLPFSVLRVMSLIYSAFSVCAGLFDPCPSKEGNWNVPFLFPTFIPFSEILQAKHPGVQSYSEPANKLISRSQQLSLTTVSCVTELMIQLTKCQCVCLSLLQKHTWESFLHPNGKPTLK